MNRVLTLAVTGLLIGFLPATSVLAGVAFITECGTVISEPGEYKLTQDLLLCPVDGITISSSNVKLDLKGHTITCDDRYIYGIKVRDFSDVDIKNGTVTGCRNGVYLRDVSDSQVTKMTLNGNRRHGLYMRRGSSNVIKNNLLIGNEAYGISVWEGDGHLISKNITNENRHVGIDGDTTQNTKYTCNQSNRNGNIGIALSGTEGGNVLIGNIANENRLAGIVMSGWPSNEIPEGNTIKHNIALANNDKDLSENSWGPEGPYVEDGAPCRNTWIDNEFVTELGPEMCIGVPAQLDDDDVCALDDDGDDD
jgi:parallel beta-helix repeat protein